MLKQFTGFIAKHSLFTSENKILLAVSGGLDSMVMLDLFIRAGFRIGVAHVNFQLRGIESDRDHDFIASFCSKRGIECHTKRVDTNNYATGHKLSLQMAARGLRYDWFRHLLDGGYDLLATAHHQSDSVETVILNLLRGSGNEGLAGIPILNEMVVRPLMFASREDLLVYAAEHEVTWREDESNQTSDYQRNQVRHGVVPILRSINPGLETTFQRIAKKAAGDEELIEIALMSWKASYIKIAGDQVKIDKRGVETFMHPEALLLRLIEPLGFNFANVTDVIGAINGQPGKVFHSSSHNLVIDRSHIIITPRAVAVESVSIAPGSNTSTFGPFELSIHEQQHAELIKDPKVAYLDKDKVSFPLRWRAWKEGDYFFPLGMRGKKKVSDFLIDLKLSLPDKESVTVIESADSIVCLPGLRIDDRFKVTTETKTALVLELKGRK